MDKITEASFNAHQRTCLLSNELIQVGFSQGISEFKVEQFKRMVSDFINIFIVISHFVVAVKRGSVDHCGRENDSNYPADY